MTQFVFEGDLSNPVSDGSPFVAPDGTQYPLGFPKTEIPGMVQVVETEQPSDPAFIVNGHHIELIDGVPTRVWETEPVPLPPPAPAPEAYVPRIISKRQFLIAAWQSGLITEAEALAAASNGALPAAIAVALTSLPADQQVAFKITWAAMVQVDRDNAFVPVMAAVFGKSDEDIDQFFREAAAL